MGNNSVWALVGLPCASRLSTASALVSAGPGVNMGRALEMDSSVGGGHHVRARGQERIGLAGLHSDCCGGTLRQPVWGRRRKDIQ